MIVKKLMGESDRFLSKKDLSYFSFFFFCYAVSIGVNIVTFSIFLSQNSINFSSLVKMISTQFIGGIISVPLTQYISMKFRVIYSLFFGSTVRAIGILFLGVGSSDLFWYIGLFLCGIGSSRIFMCVSYILLSSSNDKYKKYGISFIIFIFATAIYFSSFFIENLHLKINNLLFIISSLISIISIFILVAIKDLYVPIKIYKMDFTKLVRISYLPVLTILYLGYVYTSLIYFIDRYLIISQYSAIHYIMMGIMISLFPITTLHKEFNYKFVFVGATLTIFITIFFIFQLNYVNQLEIMYFVFGCVSVILLIGSIKMLKSLFINQSIIHISSLIIAIYNIASFAGIFMTAQMIDIAGQNGLSYSVLLISITYLIFLFYTSKT